MTGSYVFDPEDFPDICDSCGHVMTDCTCRVCPRCGSTALGQVESVPLNVRGGTRLYLVCEDCGHELAEVGPGGGVL